MGSEMTSKPIVKSGRSFPETGEEKLVRSGREINEWEDPLPSC